MNEPRLRRLLAHAPLPDEGAAEARALAVVRAGFPVAPSRSPRDFRERAGLAIVVAACAVAIVLALTPPGAAVADWFKEALGIKPSGHPHAARALGSLPGGGRLLVTSSRGLWVVQPDGSRRLLGLYKDGGWSPHGLFVVAVRGRQLVALDPRGAVRWAISRPLAPRSPSWGPDGLRIAYLSGATLRIVEGDGAPDRLLAVGVRAVAPAWRPGVPATLAYVSAGGHVVVRDVAASRALWRSRVAVRALALAWSADGRSLAVLDGRGARLFDGHGRSRGAVTLSAGATATAIASVPDGSAFVLSARRFGRSVVYLVRGGAARRIFAGSGTFSGVAESPDGRWLLIAWADPDQWLFVRSTAVRRIRAVADITRQFNPGARGGGAFPVLRGWCCRRGGLAP